MTENLENECLGLCVSVFNFLFTFFFCFVFQRVKIPNYLAEMLKSAPFPIVL